MSRYCSAINTEVVYLVFLECDDKICKEMAVGMTKESKTECSFPKGENDVRLQATLGNQNPTGLPVGAVRFIKRQMN